MPDFVPELHKDYAGVLTREQLADALKHFGYRVMLIKEDNGELFVGTLETNELTSKRTY